MARPPQLQNLTMWTEFNKRRDGELALLKRKSSEAIEEMKALKDAIF